MTDITCKRNKIELRSLGVMNYKEAWSYQETLMHNVIEAKASGSCSTNNYLLFVEHPHVYTLGKSGKEGNMLIDSERLKAVGAEFYHTNRGGDITYHGPGQLVVYPIFDLESFGIGLRNYIFLLEKAVIDSIAEYGITGQRDDKATGVWLDVDTISARKICAIGVRSSRFVTMHGLALNVNTDLSFFNNINPCGFTDRGVTSIEKELGQKQDFEKLKETVLRHILDCFNAYL